MTNSSLGEEGSPVLARQLHLLAHRWCDPRSACLVPEGERRGGGEDEGTACNTSNVTINCTSPRTGKLFQRAVQVA